MGDLLNSFLPKAFEFPGRLMLLLVIPLLVGAYIFALSRKNKRGMRYTNTSMLEAVIGRQSAWRRHLAFGLSLLSLITLSMAYAKPMNEVMVPRERASIVLVIDVSQSMQATDVKPNRLAAAQAAAKAFVESLPEKYNVGLVAMSGSNNVVVPPQLDHASVLRGIDTLKLADSTALGGGVAAGMKALNDVPKDPNDPDAKIPGAIVMLSDGENQTGPSPINEAAKAGEAGVPVYTIAYGSDSGFVDLDGERFPVPVDKEQMKQIAEQSKGQYFEAATPEDLAVVYADIGSSVGYAPEFREITARYAGLGLVFAVLASLCAVSLAVRWP
ncbi:VWA domain-containing protein [Propionibacteriaceae bacterium Y1685]|uniref:VWA domain-containing protein n=1 Tax=Microlunatus sp. Y1700 TaxID=3418487 RepID=UPI003B7BBD5D